MPLPSGALENYVPEPNSGCWLWLGKVASTGYGKASFAGREVSAHRLFYETHVGPIPDGLTIDHLCRVRSCVNPAHMEPVARGVNCLRGVGSPAQNARKTHCGCGHPFTTQNTYVTREGYRQCRECKRTRMNLRRGRTQGDIDARRRTCRLGHPYAPPRKDGKRRCLTCNREWQRSRRAKMRSRA